MGIYTKSNGALVPTATAKGLQGIQGVQGIQGLKGDPGGWANSTQYFGNLNAATTPGTYFIGSSVATDPLNNTPTTSAGHLEVIKYPNNYMIQRYTHYVDGVTYVRTSTNAATSWGAWLRLIDTQTVRQGVGFPEGVVSAPVGTRYTDTAATNGAVEWIKATGTGNTGWKVVYGDTGSRNVTADIVAQTPGFQQGGMGGARIQRVGNQVTLVIPQFGCSTSGLLYTVPTGYRATSATNNAQYAFPVMRNNAAVAQLQIGQYSGLASVTLGGTVSIYAHATMTWVTNDPWPATLPGTVG